MSWIREVLDATDEAETPKQFIFWAALAALAAVMRKQVWLNKHIYKLYPNIYVLLIAESGLGKAFPISLAKQLVRQTKVTRVIAGRNSIQAVIQDLGKAYTLAGGGMITDAHGFLAASEFASFLVKDEDALTILTDLYDTHDHEPEWRNTLKMGTETLSNPCLTMFSASNPTHFRDKVANKDVEGGFVGRTLMIMAKDKYKLNPLVDEPEFPFDVSTLVPYLKEISKLEGPFKWSEEGKALYKEWYFDFRGRKHNDKTGTSNRLHDHILKVAMLLSLSRRFDLILSGQDIQEAIDACVGFMTNVTKTILPGKSTIAESTKLILYELINCEGNQLTRQQLLRKLVGDIDVNELDKVIETLQQAGLVQPRRHGNGIMYALSPVAVRRYLEAKEE
jgi:hypothetical protein